MKPLKVAILGAGIGREHLNAYQYLPDLYNVSMVCDLDEARAKELASDASSDWCTDMKETIGNPDIDIIDICLPPWFHEPVTIKALQNGQHVICEKPIAGSLRGLDKITAAEAASQGKVLPIYQYRYGHGVQQLFHLMGHGFAQKAYGGTIEVHWNRDAAYYASPWRGRWEKELGGAIVGHAIHLHDLLTAVLGPVNSVQAFLDTIVNDIETDDCGAIALKMSSGALVTSSITLGSVEDHSRVRFCFDDLTVESGTEPYNPGKLPWRFMARQQQDQQKIDSLLADFKLNDDGFKGQLKEAAAFWELDQPLPLSLVQAKQSLELITAIYRSSRTGQAVSLPVSSTCSEFQSWTPESFY